MLLIKSSISHRKEREYIFEVIFKHFLGLDYTIKYDDRKDICIELLNQSEICMPDILFNMSNNKWLTKESLPKQPLKLWNVRDKLRDCNLVSMEIPIIYGDFQILSQNSPKKNVYYIPLDIFGSVFFMLSRYEELVKHERDKHNRFSAASSLAFQEDFLDRPIVDEYVEILYCLFRFLLGKEIERKYWIGRTEITCDIDNLYDPASTSLLSTSKSFVGDILKRRDFKLGFKRILNYPFSKLGIKKFDPYFTFNWYMNLCERYNKKITFFVLTENTSPFDGDYDIYHKKFLRLLKEIYIRGHNIGLHGSYESYMSYEMLKKQRERLVSALNKAGVPITPRGIRQHYLRWDSSETPSILEKVGFSYDSTGGYADHVGFRYGTSRPFPLWDWKEGKKLSIMEKPLIVMEGTIVDGKYMGLGYSEKTLHIISLLHKRALMYGGNFVILWHNSRLAMEKERNFFKNLISILK